MPNYLYPGSADSWVGNHPAIKQLPKAIKTALTPKLARWSRQQSENARPIGTLPEGAPDWAAECLASGQTVDHFIASPTTREIVQRIGGFLDMLIAVRDDGADPQLSLLINRLLRRIGSGQAGVPEVLEKEREWMAQPAYREVLRDLGYLTDEELPATENGQWRELLDLNQAQRVGKVLDNCLANGYYDEDLQDREQSNVRLFTLQAYDNGKPLAVAAFRHGQLEDFEAAGADPDVRQRRARKAYKGDLIDLLKALDYAVSPDDGELVVRTGICGRDDLDRFQSAEAFGVRVWSDRADTLIVYPPGCGHVIPIDIAQGADSRYVLPRDEATEVDVGASEGCSLRRQIDLALLDQTQFDLLCRALSVLVRRGKLDLELWRFHEFSTGGAYWATRRQHAIKTMIGHLLAYKGCVWWVPDQGRRLAYVIYDRALEKGYDPLLREHIAGLVAARYTQPIRFWNALIKLRVPYPDMRRNAIGAPVLEPTIYRRKRIDASEGWSLRRRCTKRGYEVRSRPVDDHQRMVNTTEQWVCWHPQHGPVTGLLVRHVGPRKRRFDLQAPGQDPQALALLMQTLREAGLDNAFSSLHSDHDLSVLDRPIEKQLLRDDAQPVRPTTAIRGTGLSFRRNGPRVLVFDADERLVLALSTDKERRLRRAQMLSEPDRLRTEFPALMAHLGVELTDALQPIARQLGYRVTDGVLEVLPPLPEFDDPPVKLTGNEDRVDIDYTQALNGFDADDIDHPKVRISLQRSGALILLGAIEPDRDDDDVRQVRDALCQAANYLGAPLTAEIGRGFGLQRLPNGHYRLDDTDPPPPGWSLIGDGDQVWWQLADDLGRPAAWYRDGAIGFEPAHLERLLKAGNAIRAFLAWQDTRSADRTMAA
ncbi:hypothetical protein CKO42_08330 [Lamprobacter modestohalophilus]|uniref:Uncharacterized protein n=1 Tax=Lamprobacter modestohalophilus TaxID=1064514 RepID=A0A9X0W7V3_9GAMM|nr:hypothetical protein [Lamprobacter modestohalophilus]MBK1618442.1 hypothetical protein [Lamprobacter modestohalophilus]